MKIIFRHILFLFTCCLFVGLSLVQAQIAGNVVLEIKALSPGCDGEANCSMVGADAKNQNIVFSGGTLPGFMVSAGYDAGVHVGCSYSGNIASIGAYDAGAWQVVILNARPSNCKSQSTSFRWTPQNMHVPTTSNNSVCSGTGFTLTLPMKANDKIDQYYWEQSTDNGASWVPVTGASSHLTTAPSIVIMSSTAGNILYRAKGFRNGVLVAPASGGLPVYVFPAAPDNIASSPQDDSWRLTESIPLMSDGKQVGSINVTNNTCENGSNAKINVTFTQNVIGNYYYSLAGGIRVNKTPPSDKIFDTIPNAVMNISPTQLSHTFPDDAKNNQFGLVAGDYTLAIENVDNGQRYCYGKYHIKIKAPAPVTFTEASRSNPTCIGGKQGQIVVTAGGGATALQYPAYNYTVLMYKNGSLDSTRTGLAAGNHTFGGLGAGNYHFEIKESGCGTGVLKRYPTAGTIPLTDPPTTMASATKTNIICEGGTGAIEVKLTQGNPNGTYTIVAQKDGTPHATATGITLSTGSHTFANLPAGNYTFDITHTCGSGAYSITTPVVLTDLVPIAGTLTGIKQIGSSHELSCNGASDGKIEVELTAGNTLIPNVAYSLVLKKNGTPFTVGAGGYTAVAGITPTNIKVGQKLVFTRLTADTYSIEVSQNNCSHPAKSLGNVTLTAPVALSADIAPVLKFDTYHVTCANGEDGQIEVDNIAGGNGSYTIEIYENGSKINPVTEVAGSKTIFKGLRPASFQGGTIGYIVKVTDSKNCDYTLSNIQLLAPAALTTVLTTQRVTCKGESNGSVTAKITGGIKPYTVQWVDGNDAAITTEITLGASDDTHILNNRPAGTYKLRVKDAKGCYNFVNGGWLITTTTVDEPTLAFAFETPSFIIDSVSCHGASNGRITLAVTGGWGNYSYSKDGTNYQASPAFSGFAAGTYTLYAKDGENCIISSQVIVSQPEVLSLSQQQINNVSCKGGRNGVFVYEAKGGNDAGTQPYALLVNGAAYAESDWSNWTTNQQITLRGLAAGSYTVKATDHKGCSQTLTFTITEPAELMASLKNITQATCGIANGAASVLVTGGTSPYVYAWNKYNGATGTIKKWSTTANLNNAESGAYEMIVTDALGCSVTRVIQISNADAATVQHNSINAVSCAENKDGSATFTVSGDFPIVVTWAASGETGQITWQNAQTLVLSGLSKGYHEFQTKDNKGCIRFEQVLIPGPEPLLVTRNNSNDPACHNSNNGSLDISVSGGTTPYTIQWNNGLAAGATSFDNLVAGTYTATVTDTQGCTRQASFILQNPLPISVDLGTGSTVCAGQSITLKPVVPGGNTIATYAWTSASGTLNSNANEVTVNVADTYFLTVTTTTGCTGKGQYTLENSADAFEADFLMPADAVVGDTVALIEICRPAPTALFWDIEGLDQMVTSLETTVTNPKQRLIFSEPGTYTVRLYASAGNCQDVFTRTITIGKADGKRYSAAQAGNNGQQIQAKASPNPISNGKFRLEVNLAKKEAVQIDIIRVSSGNRWRLPKTLSGSGKTHYEWSLDIPELTQGTYAVRVLTPTAQKIVKVVVN